jgi:hypothetical protein
MPEDDCPELTSLEKRENRLRVAKAPQAVIRPRWPGLLMSTGGERRPKKPAIFLQFLGWSQFGHPVVLYNHVSRFSSCTQLSSRLGNHDFPYHLHPVEYLPRSKASYVTCITSGLYHRAIHSGYNWSKPTIHYH